MKLVFAIALTCSAAAESDSQFRELMTVLQRQFPQDSSPARDVPAHDTTAYVGNNSDVPGYFFRGITPVLDERYIAAQAGENEDSVPQWLASHTHYRLLPGSFPSPMKYHFDGLAAVALFNFTSDGGVSFQMKSLESKAYRDWKKCVFVGSGTGPTLGTEVCMTNPAVNLLPIRGELWLTIDTSKWARIDPNTLDTLPDVVNISSMVLNAHPACDRATGECFVQYPCGDSLGGTGVWDDDVCVATLEPNASGTGMAPRVITHAKLPAKKMVQHSHSPCVTEHFVISKLDSFTPRAKSDAQAGGVLKFARQAVDSSWLVMDRATSATRVLHSNAAFVNNHFANCYEEDGQIVIDTVPATGDYLDTYYEDQLALPTNWTKILREPMRCRVPFSGNDTKLKPGIRCSTLLVTPTDASAAVPTFDYPTFNPLLKMRGVAQGYRSLYAIAPSSLGSKWFDKLIKIDAATGNVSKAWSADNVFLTEADFVPNPNSVAAVASGASRDDDGVLLSVLYNATIDQSMLAVFDAAELNLLATYPLGQVLPFHAHGIVCSPAEGCFTNP